MPRKPKFRPLITRIKLNPEQAVLACNCYDTSVSYGMPNIHSMWGTGTRDICGNLKVRPGAVVVCSILGTGHGLNYQPGPSAASS